MQSIADIEMHVWFNKASLIKGFMWCCTSPNCCSFCCCWAGVAPSRWRIDDCKALSYSPICKRELTGVGRAQVEESKSRELHSTFHVHYPQNSPRKQSTSVCALQALQYLRKLCSHPLMVLQPTLPLHLSASTAATNTHTWEAAQAALHASLEHAPKLLALHQLLQQCNIGCKAEDGGPDVEVSVQLVPTV